MHGSSRKPGTFINELEDPDINPHSYSHLVMIKMPKMYIIEKTPSSSNGAEKTVLQNAEK